MKRTLKAIILAIVLIVSILPFSALASGEPFSLEAPQNLTAALKYDVNGTPYFELRLNIPESVRKINENLKQDPEYYSGTYCSGIEIKVDYKYGQYDWNLGPSLYWDNTDYVSEFIDRGGYWEYRPFDSGDFNTTDIKAEVYSFRTSFHALWGPKDGWIDKDLYSGYSGVATIGTPAFYSSASDWAKPELKEANDLGLVPDILKGADLTKPITREEFCELAVLLYEKSTGKVSEAASPNPFTDTTNPRILKAYKLGITTGTSTTTFSPKVLINREQCAAMLFRAIKAIKPNGNYSIAGVKDFPDQQYISDWAAEAAKFMSKAGIITGDDNGNFMPKATTTVQEAEGYGMATREQAIALSARTYKKIPTL